ncbi:MAG: 50S ribosomal protein L9, partial [Sulfurimicrobium sp.]
VDGRLFGSVTTGDISDALKAQGFEVAKSEVRLPNGPLKAVGEASVDLSLHADITATITVSVVAAA